MGAIIQLSEYRSRRVLPDHHPDMESARELIRDAMTQLIMDDFRDLPLAVTTLAIQEVGRALSEDGQFADAFIAMADVLRRGMADMPRPFLWEAKLLKAARFRIVEAVLRKRCPASTFIEALNRAQRVIDGGGCIQIALYQAIGDDPGAA